MKKINKNSQPKDLMNWYAKNSKKSPQNIKYNQAEFPREEVLKALLKEQGYLCAYTLKRICLEHSHIEHLKPQSICEAEDSKRQDKGLPSQNEDVAWHNLVACFPGPKDPHPRYGAFTKGDWWDKSLFVSPLSQTCESRFHYDRNGGVAPANPSDGATKETIKRLNLDHPPLRELRHTAILKAQIHPKSSAPIRSLAQVERLIKEWGKRSADHSFRETLINSARILRA